MGRKGYGSRYDTTRPLSYHEIPDVSGGDHEFTEPTRSIMITGAGDMTIRLLNDTRDLTLTVAAGALLPLVVSHVRRGTTATMVGFW